MNNPASLALLKQCVFHKPRCDHEKCSLRDKWKWKHSLLSLIQLLATLQTVARQAPLSMEISKQDTGRLPFPSPGDHPNPEIEPRSPTLQADSLPSEPPKKGE